MATPILIVTGTGTGVGKTIVTAALAALARERGESVAVVKPAQTGVQADEPGDLDVVARLGGASSLHELARYPDPLAPAAASRLSELPAPSRPIVTKYIAELADTHDLVLVEGAGGSLVQFDNEGTTIVDLATDLVADRGTDLGVELIVVADPGLGTLNHTALTLEALERRGYAAPSVVLGRWPTNPDLACRSNLIDLAVMLGAPINGAIQDAAAHLERAEFLAVAKAGLAPHLGGQFDGADFTQRFDPRRNM